jgi:FkbM family methyltransferase
MAKRSLLNWILLTGQDLQSRLFSRILGPHCYAVIANSSEGLFAIDPRDRGVGRHHLLWGAYAQEELERLKSFVRPSGRVLVVGSHIGSMVIPLARCCRELIALEPNPASNRLLRLNLTLNAITNCTVLDVAANDRTGHIEMLANTANSGGSKRMPQRVNHAYVYDKPQVIQVPCAPLDELLVDHQFDLIVMDIEGSEYFALRGMPQILAASSVLAVEFLPHSLRNVGNVGVKEFLEPISAQYSQLFVPSKSLTVARKDFLPVLQRMYERNEGDAGLVFTR